MYRHRVIQRLVAGQEQSKVEEVIWDRAMPPSKMNASRDPTMQIPQFNETVFYVFVM